MDRIDEIMAEFRQDDDIGAILRAMESMQERWNEACNEVGFGRHQRRPFTPVELALEALLEALGMVDLQDLAELGADREQ